MTGPLLEPDEEVTQYGRNDPSGFKNRPLEGNVLSAIRGRVDVEDAVRYVIKGRRAIKGEGVRVARVEALLTSGFAVRGDPHPLNPLHVRIEYSGAWDETVGEAFDSCFEEPVFKEDD